MLQYAIPEVEESLLDFLLRVHHKRAVLHNWLPNGLPSKEKEPDALHQPSQCDRALQKLWPCARELQKLSLQLSYIGTEAGRHATLATLVKVWLKELDITQESVGHAAAVCMYSGVP